MSDTARTIVLRNNRLEVGRLSDFIERYGREHGLDENSVMNVTLVLDEAVVNVIAHGYVDRGEHEISVRLALEGDRLRIDVEDDGVAFDPRETPPPRFDLPIAERPVGGLGVHIVKSMTESLDYRREGGRNHFSMTMKVVRQPGTAD